MGGIKGGAQEEVAFVLSYVKMYVICTVKDREEVLKRKVCELIQRKRSTGHFQKPVMRWILPEHMEYKNGEGLGSTLSRP